jgi:hypothetical protein
MQILSSGSALGFHNRGSGESHSGISIKAYIWCGENVIRPSLIAEEPIHGGIRISSAAGGNRSNTTKNSGSHEVWCLRSEVTCLMF